MVKASVLWTSLALCVALLALGCGESPLVSGGTEIPNGKLVFADGTPAAGATVTFVTVDHNPAEGIAKTIAVAGSVQTNDEGVYFVDSMPPGWYNVFGEKDGLKSYLDSVFIPEEDTATLDTDTLKEPGSIFGSIRMAAGFGISDARICAIGTESYAKAQGILGDFSMANLAEGTYRARATTASNRFLSIPVTFTVHSGKTDTQQTPIVLISATITGLFVDSGQTKWIGSASGLAQYRANTWLIHSQGSGLSNNAISAITQDKSGNLWVGTANGLNVYNGQKWERYDHVDGMSSPTVKSLAVDSAGNIWAGTADGLDRLYGRFWIASPYINGLSNGTVTAIAATDSAIWVGTGSGASRFAANAWKTYTTSDSLASNSVTCITVGKDGTIWVGTQNGLSTFDGSTWKSYGLVDGLTNACITSLAVDKTGCVWAGTLDGLNKFDGEKWQGVPIAGQSSIKVNAITVDSDNGIWIGTNTGLLRFDGDNWELFS